MRTQDNVNLMFLGHLSDEKLVAGAGLGNACGCFMGIVAIFGMNMAMSTLVSQAAGVNNLKLCGRYLNRGRFILLILFIPYTILTFYIEEILLAIG